MTECHLSMMSQQTTTVTNRASVMHTVIHAWYMSGLISGSVYIAIADSGPRGPRYIGATLYHNSVANLRKFTGSNPNLGLVKVNAYAKFDQILSICLQDIERNFYNNQGP